MTCLVCVHSSARDKVDIKRDRTLREMFALGMINCIKSEGRATFHSFDHRCEMFSPLPQDKATMRTDAAKKLEARWQRS